MGDCPVPRDLVMGVGGWAKALAPNRRYYWGDENVLKWILVVLLQLIKITKIIKLYNNDNAFLKPRLNKMPLLRATLAPTLESLITLQSAYIWSQTQVDSSLGCAIYQHNLGKVTYPSKVLKTLGDKYICIKLFIIVSKCCLNLCPFTLMHHAFRDYSFISLASCLVTQLRALGSAAWWVLGFESTPQLCDLGKVI